LHGSPEFLIWDVQTRQLDATSLLQAKKEAVLLSPYEDDSAGKNASKVSSVMSRFLQLREIFVN
jgi:hypothetical protein